MTDMRETGEATPKQTARSRKAAELTNKAVEAYEIHKRGRSLKLAQDAIKTGALTLIDSARLVELLKALDKASIADRLTSDTMARVDTTVEQAGDDSEVLFETGHACLELGFPDRAEPILLRANELAPSDGRPAILLIRILLTRGDPDKLLEVWEPFLKTTDAPGTYLLLLAGAFAQFGFVDHAEKVLVAAEPYHENDPAPLQEARAALRGQEVSTPQRETATRIFDSYAQKYDENLKAIGNKGPEMMARMLSLLEFAPDQSRTFLDAGCGTGLCAPYLRPYASHVHGCDVSVKMLEVSKGKGVYDLLTRTDLNVRATLPDGPFDVIVSGDVLVYFGDLLPVFRILSEVLKPGGWFLFTVETCTGEEPAKGYEVKPSGRYGHGAEYLKRTLVQSGFSKPKNEFTDVLRHDFRVPIVGRVVAAQKLALFG